MLPSASPAAWVLPCVSTLANKPASGLLTIYLPRYHIAWVFLFSKCFFPEKVVDLIFVRYRSRDFPLIPGERGLSERHRNLVSGVSVPRLQQPGWLHPCCQVWAG